MKHRIRKTLSLVLALIMLLSMVPLVYAAEDADEFAGLETLEEIPFEFVLEPGDLPYELLREAVLDVRDIPACIDPALAEERGHVNRLYLQEPDDCTVMFQNRDGSKTIYLFSHPVKGMTASTVATVQINGTSVSFSGENAVTSRLAEITNFNIGSAEIAYLPVGVLSENGVNITEDVRSWTLAESIDVVQAYNISSEAAAEYAASVAVPETDAAATAAAAPGITITPNDPAPLGGMTVMSISYSDLAGVMRFKNVSTNKYLTFSNSSLTVSTSFQLKYSEWVVQYDSFFGYVVSNLSDPYNTYIGYDDTETFMIDTLSYMMYAIEPVIVSTSASTVRLQCSLSAIDSNAQMYELSPSESNYPDSCTWQIMNKRNIRLVTSISVPNTTVIKQSGVGYIYTDNYSFERPFPTYYEIEIYDATTNQPFDFDTKIYEDDEYWCTINTPGIYTAYYKDNVTGVRSVEFMLIVVDSMEVYESNITYSIRSYITSQNSEDLYLSVNSSTGLELMTKDLDSRTVVRETGSDTILCERLANISRTFTFKHVDDSYDILSGVYITATMSTSQYTGLPERSLVEEDNYHGNYFLTNKNTIPNTIKYVTDSGLSLTAMNHIGTPFALLDMGDYYIIAVAQYLTSASPVIMALKASGNSVVVEEYTTDSTDANAFKWYIDQIGVDVPLIKQIESVWCGPASYLQVLLGKSENVVGDRYDTTLNFQQSTIKATFTDFQEGSGVTTRTFYSKINSGEYLPSGYTCHELETINTDSIKNAIKTSLNQGMACMFQTHTGRAPYKEAYTGRGHIICIIGYDEVTETVLISNCHYGDTNLNGKEYLNIFGIYEIDFEDFCEDIKNLWYFTYSE